MQSLLLIPIKVSLSQCARSSMSESALACSTAKYVTVQVYTNYNMHIYTVRALSSKCLYSKECVQIACTSAGRQNKQVVDIQHNTL